MLFLSRLHYKKRPELLLESLSQLKTQGYSFHAIFAGSGEPSYINSLQRLVTSVGIEEQVTFAGHVVGAEKDLLLQGADLFALPSYSENFGIAVAEALVAGLPVVITPEIQIADDVKAANAGAIASGEVESFTKAIAELLIAPQLRQELSTNAKRLAQTRYSWKAIARQLASSYEEIALNKSLSIDAKVDKSVKSWQSSLT